MTEDKRTLPIGVFDSGIGGLTVVKELRELLPDEDIIYFGDTARVPYGPRPALQILDFMGQILRFFAAQPVKLAVVACNTMTALGVEENQARYPFTLVGVDTGIEAALKFGGRIGLLATQATVASGKHAAKARCLKPDAELIGVPCPKFVPLIESGRLEGAEVEQAVFEYMRPLCAKRVQSVILGCTHYPLLTELIRKTAGAELGIINPARETALTAGRLLAEKDLLKSVAGGKVRLSFSALTPEVSAMATRILTDGFSLAEVELPA